MSISGVSWLQTCTPCHSAVATCARDFSTTYLQVWNGETPIVGSSFHICSPCSALLRVIDQEPWDFPFKSPRPPPPCLQACTGEILWTAFPPECVSVPQHEVGDGYHIWKWGGGKPMGPFFLCVYRHSTGKSLAGNSSVPNTKPAGGGFCLLQMCLKSVGVCGAQSVVLQYTVELLMIHWKCLFPFEKSDDVLWRATGWKTELYPRI